MVETVSVWLIAPNRLLSKLMFRNSLRIHWYIPAEYFKILRYMKSISPRREEGKQGVWFERWCSLRDFNVNIDSSVCKCRRRICLMIGRPSHGFMYWLGTSRSHSNALLVAIITHRRIVYLSLSTLNKTCGNAVLKVLYSHCANCSQICLIVDLQNPLPFTYLDI
jgi:hypothetical protein